MQLTPVHLARVALYAILAVAVTRTLADPDLWGHVLFGRDIVVNWSIPRVDPYSFTADREWINHEWLAEVVMFGAYRFGGATGLIALKAALVMAMLGIVSTAIRAAGAKGVIHDIMLLLVALGSLPRTMHVRPQVFSVVLFAVLLAVLAGWDRGRRRRLVLLPVVFAVWANLHGGWVVGLGVLGLWGVVTLAGPGHSWRLRAAVAAVVGAALAATAVNPYGVGLWRFLWETVGLGRPYVGDWQPLWQFPGLTIVWFISALVGTLAVIRSGIPKNPALLLIVATLGCASVRVSRLDAFFSLSVVVMLSAQLARAWPGPAASQEREAVSTIASAALAAAVIVVSAVVPSAFFTASNLRCLNMDEPSLPEAHAARFVRDNALRGRMLTWFDYGEYAIWHFGHMIQVSMDGRRETVYSDSVVAAHAAAYFDENRASAYADVLGADYAWLERRLPAVRDLERTGWHPVFAGPRSVILARRPGSFLQPTGLATGLRCFPGP